MKNIMIFLRKKMKKPDFFEKFSLQKGVIFLLLIYSEKKPRLDDGCLFNIFFACQGVVLTSYQCNPIACLIIIALLGCSFP